jgi:hypothetical protein
MDDFNVKPLCDAVMRGVVASGVLAGRDDRVGPAVGIMRDEIKALLTADRYADARGAVLGRSIHDGYVLGLVVANCVSRITATAP